MSARDYSREILAALAAGDVQSLAALAIECDRRAAMEKARADAVVAEAAERRAARAAAKRRERQKAAPDTATADEMSRDVARQDATSPDRVRQGATGCDVARPGATSPDTPRVYAGAPSRVRTRVGVVVKSSYQAVNSEGQEQQQKPPEPATASPTQSQGAAVASLAAGSDRDASAPAAPDVSPGGPSLADLLTAPVADRAGPGAASDRRPGRTTSRAAADTPADPAPVTKRAAKRATPAAAPKHPQFPDADCQACYAAWRAAWGVVDYGRFRKALAPLWQADGPSYPTALVCEAIGVYREVIEVEDGFEYRQASPEKFAGRIVEWTRLAGMPIIDAWGQLTERGDRATAPAPASRRAA